MTGTPDYFTRYENLHMERTPSGVLTLRFHTDDGPVTFTGTTHRDLPKALAEIGDDRDNKVLVVTGTGDNFMDAIDGDSLPAGVGTARHVLARPTSPGDTSNWNCPLA